MKNNQRNIQKKNKMNQQQGGNKNKRTRQIQHQQQNKQAAKQPNNGNRYVTKELLGDQSAEWQKIRANLPDHYTIPDPMITQKLLEFWKANTSS